MAKTVHSRAAKAKRPREGGFVSRRRTLPIAVAIRGAAEEIWPDGPTKGLASYVGVSGRCAQQWMGGETEPSAENLIALQLGQHGQVFLDHLAKAHGATPGWIIRWRQEQAAADLEAQMAEIGEKLARVRSGARR